jgi:acetyltransferase-like isoleucine patch superfamily enzyme
MSTFPWKLTNYIQQSLLLPTPFRVVFLSRMGVDIHPSAKIAAGVFIGSNKMHLGQDVFINIHCFLDGSESITFGQHVRVGPYVKILTGSHTINPDVLRRSGTSTEINLPVEIKKGVWIGMGAIILPGVTIAEGCVIGAGSVVVHSTQPNGLYVGNPARRIRDLPVS